MAGKVIAVSQSPTHSFCKSNQETIRLLAGLGVEYELVLENKK